MTRTKERETFYADIVCTAAEGGISGWGWAEQRKMYSELIPDGGLGPQRHGGENYTFVLREIGDGDVNKTYKVTPSTIAHAYTLLRRERDAAKVGLADQYRKSILEAYYEMDAGMIDAFYADWLVQIGLWGEVIYS